MEKQQDQMNSLYEELIKIAEPDTLEKDGNSLRARFYLEDLAKKIESDKMKMADKTEEIMKKFDERFKDVPNIVAYRPFLEEYIKPFIRQALLSQRKEVEEKRDNLMGLVIRNCRGFTEIRGNKLWQLDLDSLEKDLQSLKNKQDA